jgi:heat shock protein HtpX
MAIVALRLLAILSVPTFLMLLLCVLPRADTFTTSLICAVALLGNLGFAIMVPAMSTRALRLGPHSDPSPELKAALTRLASRAGIEAPPCIILHDDELNACTIGYGEQQIMALSADLLRHMSAEEVEAMVPHECGHIKNRDASLNAVSSGIIRAFGPIAAVIAGLFALIVLVLMLFSKSRSILLLGDLAIRGGFWLSAVAFPFLMLLPQMVSSRSREHKAEAFSAQVRSRPDHLISALQRIRDAPQQRARRSANGADQPFWFTRPGGTSSTVDELLASRPPIEKRIERLRCLPVARESIGPSPGPCGSCSGIGTPADPRQLMGAAPQAAPRARARPDARRPRAN